jgi:hypothetical protein
VSDKLLGQTIAGRYDIKRLLGQGGMGAVYEATQQPLGRRIALKVIKRALTDDEVAVKRFTQEAQAVAQLSHPHIVTLHDFGRTDDELLFLAMEFLDGESLRERLAKVGKMPWEKTMPIVVEVCEALSHAHANGIIHRDLKPDNIVLVNTKGRDDYVKVVDFGVAKLMEGSSHQTTLTGTGMAVGTPGYIAPEQLDGIGDEPRIDLYALGVMWFEMLTGRSPFQAETPIKLVLKHVSEPAPRPSSVNPEAGVPPAVDALVQRLMGKKPDARAASVDALLAELQELWAQAGALPPEAATAGLQSGEVAAIQARSAPSTPGAPIAAPSPTPAPPTTPAGATPATAGVVAPPPADAARPRKKSRAQLFLALGCLGTLGTCGLCVAVAGGGGSVATEQLGQEVEGALLVTDGGVRLDMDLATGEIDSDGNLKLNGPAGSLTIGKDGNVVIDGPGDTVETGPSGTRVRTKREGRRTSTDDEDNSGELNAFWKNRVEVAASDLKKAVGRNDAWRLNGGLRKVFLWPNKAARDQLLAYLATERKALLADPDAPARLKEGWDTYDRVLAKIQRDVKKKNKKNKKRKKKKDR